MGSHHWARREINIIRKFFHVKPDYEISNYLPGRSVLAIAQKRRNMGLKYTQEWMNEQVQIQMPY